MKLRSFLIICLLLTLLCFSVYAKQSAFEDAGILSSVSDLRFGALLFFFAFIAVLPTFHIRGGGQNGS